MLLHLIIKISIIMAITRCAATQQGGSDFLYSTTIQGKHNYIQGKHGGLPLHFCHLPFALSLCPWFIVVNRASCKSHKKRYFLKIMK